jgi:CTP:phosphocholine cytidylyltransferase-like protein
MAFEILTCGLGAKRFVSISFMTQSGLVKVAINPMADYDLETSVHRHI